VPFNLSLPTYELIAAVVLVLAAGLFVLPRLWRYLELLFLKKFTEIRLGPTPYMPKQVISKKEFREAVAAAQRAMTSHHGRLRYRIKVIAVPDPIEESIRIEGTTEVSITRRSPMQSAYIDPKKDHIQMVVRIDVTKHGNQTKAHWRFLPDDSNLFQTQVQIHDPAIDYMMAKTNFELLRHLGPLAAM